MTVQQLRIRLSLPTKCTCFLDHLVSCIMTHPLIRVVCEAQFPWYLSSCGRKSSFLFQNPTKISSALMSDLVTNQEHHFAKYHFLQLASASWYFSKQRAH